MCDLEFCLQVTELRLVLRLHLPHPSIERLLWERKGVVGVGERGERTRAGVGIRDKAGE
jgi:hypothetical protein